MRIAFATGGTRWPVDKGVLAVGVKTTADDGTVSEDELHFTVPSGFHAHPDCVGAALSTLCGRKYAEIRFDFPISSRARQMIAGCYGVSVTGATGGIDPRRAGCGLVLNFSGGFDSLAAMLSVGSCVPLISMDFGPPFEREERYFSSFDTTICKTDLRQKGYALNDWRFMASGSIMFADCFDAGMLGFGSIFEAAPWHFNMRTAAGAPKPHGPFGAIGTTDVSWMRPLTEFGTAMIVLSRAPEMASRSLASLAAPGTEKLYRKQLLLEVASRRLGLSEADSTTRVKPRTRSHWGNSFTVDVLSIFFVQEYGRAFVEEWMELPEDDEFCAIVESDLSFYLKYNANLIGYIPREVRNAVLNSFHECGLFPYNELDYQSFDRVRRYLARTYDI